MKSDNKPWYAKIKCSFLRSLLSPFCIVFQYHLTELFIWVVYILIASQLGTIINVIWRWRFNGWTLQAALVPDTMSGSFYTFCLVMVSSLIEPIFLRLVKKEKPEYRRIHIVFVTILIVTLLSCAVFYSFSSINAPVHDYTDLKDKRIGIDVAQLLFFIIALLFSLYSFGLSFMGRHEDVLHLEDDYLPNENKRVESMSDQSLKQNVSANTPDGKPLKI